MVKTHSSPLYCNYPPQKRLFASQKINEVPVKKTCGSKYDWQICVDMKVVSLLMDLQIGYKQRKEQNTALFFASGTEKELLYTSSGEIALREHLSNLEKQM
ncbi:hypothetical protein TNIN_278771 [Trichonephila inaurata madagascariensis]|uniref:Uncharacterized protein n=1 Tax=Trichonephila inaurata madagascariensis TaxID=2747483 RepID=A0A8X7C0X9_9ARAC|nr:hypothetical protein TNIN_278771 [Trichonephila inaurata madagascariensis]